MEKTRPKNGSPCVDDVVDLTAEISGAQQYTLTMKRASPSSPSSEDDGVPLRKMPNTMKTDTLQMIRAQVRHNNKMRLQNRIADLKATTNAGMYYAPVF